MRRVHEVKSSCSILSQHIASDRRPMLVTPWHPLMLSSRSAIVCLAMHHSPTSVTCGRVGAERRSVMCQNPLACIACKLSAPNTSVLVL